MGSEKIKKYRRLVSYEERKKALLKVTEESLNSGKCILHKQSCTIVLLFFLDTPTARTISRINPCKSHCWFFPFSIQIIYFIVSGLRKAETGKSKLFQILLNVADLIYIVLSSSEFILDSDNSCELFFLFLIEKL